MPNGDPRPTGRPLAYRIGAAAAELGISERQLWRLIGSGEVQAIRAGHAILIPTVSLEDWISKKLKQGVGVANAEG